MRAQVVAIHAGTKESDGRLWYTLKVEGAYYGFEQLRVHGGVINTTHEVKIGDEFSLDILPAQAKVDESPILEMGKGKANAKAAAGRHES